MTSSLLRADPAKIPTTTKEGIVDILVNLTFQRISGHGDEGSVVYGVRPRSSFSSAFLLPRPPSLGESDEVTQPIHISAHGLDFQVRREAKGQIVATPQLQVYVRVLPTLEDMKRPDCILRFRLNDTTRKHLKDVLFAALNEKWKEIGAGYKRRMDYPDWKTMDVTRFRRHKSTSSLKLLERKRAHLVKMTVPADSIVKTFNVIKHV